MKKDFYGQWKKDEKAPFAGWDFSYLKDRWIDEQPPWGYKQEAKELIKDATAVLDIGTGGGEILASLGPFPEHVIAIEGWTPNVSVAKKRLEPLGIGVVEIDESGKLPFADGEFDLVLNRHSAFDGGEIHRILRKEGIFLTQQVSGSNLEDLIQQFGVESQFKSWSVDVAKQQLEEVGFEVEKSKDWSGKVEFKDVGAIVYFLKVIPWIVKDFSVDKYLSTLRNFQGMIKRGEKLVFTKTRFLIRARK